MKLSIFLGFWQGAPAPCQMERPFHVLGNTRSLLGIARSMTSGSPDLCQLTDSRHISTNLHLDLNPPSSNVS